MPVSEILGSAIIQQLVASKMQEECHFPAEVMKASYPLHSDPGIGDPKMITDSDKKPIFDFYPRYFPLL